MAPAALPTCALLILLGPRALAQTNHNCGQAGEGGAYPQSVTVGCSNGEKIAGVTFANYGLPTGKCGGDNPLAGAGGKGTFEPGKTCAVDGTKVAYQACVGQPTCTIDCGPPNVPGAGNKIFDKDPCVGTQKHCAIVVQCPTDPCIRNPALCAFYDTGKDGGWGWTFLLLLSLAGAFYALGGVAYNHKQKGMPLNVSALPHREQWTAVLALVTDGALFSKAKFDEARAKHAGQAKVSLLEEESIGSGVRPPPRKKKEPVPEPVQDDDDDWQNLDRDMLEHRESGVHSSMQKIKVEIIRDAVE